MTKKIEITCTMREFSSLEELNTFIQNYEQRNFVQLWKRDTRNLESMKKVCPLKLRNCNYKLKYYSATFACSRGGRKFTPKGVGLRYSSTAKDDCPMCIKIKVSADGQKLQIVSLHENHNHIIDKDTFGSLPKQRRLDLELKNNAKSLLQSKGNKKVHQDYLQNKSCKPIRLSDISNLKSSKQCSVTNLENILNILHINDNIVHVVVDEDFTLLGIYYQTPWMQACFAAYPELLMLNGMYKLNHLDMPVYVLMSINGNHEEDPVAIFVVTEESTAIISHMTKVFKECNKKWRSVKTILTNKDFGEKSVLYAEFPNAAHQLCMFHVLKRFQTALSDKSMDIDTVERNMYLKLLRKITFSKTESEYDSLYQRLMDLNHEIITEYYNKNWHVIKEEWVQCYRNENLTFGFGSMNNIKFFQKVKSVCDNSISLDSFFENFNNLLNSIIANRSQTANLMLLKRQVMKFKQGSLEYRYSKLLTPQAFKLVLTSIQNCSDYDVLSDNSGYTVVSELNEHKVEPETYKCTCSFYISNNLPCSHIFAVKNYEKDFFNDESIVQKRHLKSTYVQVFKHSSLEYNALSHSHSNTEETKKRTITTHQKYQIAISKCEKIASIISSFDLEEFNTSCNELDTMLEYWTQIKTTKTCFRDSLIDGSHTNTSNETEIFTENITNPEQKYDVEVEIAEKSNPEILDNLVQELHKTYEITEHAEGCEENKEVAELQSEAEVTNSLSENNIKDNENSVEFIKLPKKKKRPIKRSHTSNTK